MTRILFVCSPLRGKNFRERENNRVRAWSYVNWLERRTGCKAIAPHTFLHHGLDDNDRRQRAMALRCCLGILKDCDELHVFGWPLSPGMAEEVDAATFDFGIPVHYWSSRP